MTGMLEFLTSLQPTVLQFDTIAKIFEASRCKLVILNVATQNFLDTDSVNYVAWSYSVFGSTARIKPDV